jgi:anti-sigma factor RsiW
MRDAHLDEALSAFLDDELAPAARREAEGHLERCAECRTELAEVAAVRSAVRSLPVHALPSHRWPELAETPGRRRPLLWGAAAAAAALVAMLLPQETQVAPALPSFVDSHATRASVTGDPLTQLAPIAVPAGLDR